MRHRPRSAKPGELFAQRARLTPIAAPGTHEGLLAHPEEIAKAVLSVDAVDRTRAWPSYPGPQPKNGN
jgi:hypothetical protein